MRLSTVCAFINVRLRGRAECALARSSTLAARLSRNHIMNSVDD